MRQCLNQVFIGGLLDEIDLEERNKDGRDYISGKVTFLVRQTITGVPEENYIPVSCFAYKMTSKGTENPFYKNLYELYRNGISIKARGSELEADYYEMTNGAVRVNSFTDKKTNQLVNTVQISNGFFNKKSRGPDYAKFVLEPFILDMIDEVVDDVPTGRLILDTAIVQYKDRVDRIKLVVEKPNAIDYVRNNYQVDDTVNVNGMIRVAAVTQESESPVEMGFGEDIAKVRQKIVREFVITSGSVGPLDEPKAYNREDIERAIAVAKAEAKTNLEEKIKPVRVSRGF